MPDCVIVPMRQGEELEDLEEDGETYANDEYCGIVKGKRKGLCVSRNAQNIITTGRGQQVAYSRSVADQ